MRSTPLPLCRDRARRDRGSTAMLVIGILAVLALVALGMLLLPNGDDRRDRARSADLYPVQRGDFTVAIPASGELVAEKQIEIRNELESRATITHIVDEGTYVDEGDLLLQLNDEDIRNRIKDAEDDVNSARSALISAQATLSIRKSTRESDIDRAKLDVELARLALDAWRDGEVEARRQQLRLAVERAERNYQRLEQRVKDSETLFEREFISADELERERIEKMEAHATLLQVRKDLQVYENYTYLQEKAQMESDLEQARAELERVKQRHDAEIETARADVSSRKFQFESREQRLADLQRQLEYCEVRAPSAGLVVYASSMESSRRGSHDPPEVGTDLSRNELVMVLPDTSRMIAAVKVNEALSGLIRPGQQVTVTSDAAPGTTIDGEVIRIGVLAETGGWRDPHRRDYTVRVLLHDTDGLGLRPSMRARANIRIDEVHDAHYVPVQSVFRDGRRAFVYVPEGNGYVPQSVRIGRASELYVEITDGLNEGDVVLLRRPNSGEILREHRNLHDDAQPIGDPQQEQEELAQR